MGKGSSKGHTPREAKDNLKSTQLLSVIDAISEGPIEGPVDGLKSVLSGVILRIRILNGRGGRLPITTEARYCEVVLPLMVMSFSVTQPPLRCI